MLPIPLSPARVLSTGFLCLAAAAVAPAQQFGQPEVLGSEAWGANCVVAADLNGDGWRDLLSCGDSGTAATSEIAWYANLGGAGYGAKVIVESGIAPRAVIGGDLDGDGDIDILAGLLDELAWYENLGGGSFGARQTIATDAGAGFAGLAGADLSGDGLDDLLVTTRNGGTVSWYESLGAGVFGAPVVLLDEPGARDARAGDFDGDGDIDVVASSWTTGLAWYSNDGLGVLTLAAVLDAGATSAALVAEDLDADGDLDIGAAGELSDKVSWYENDGTGVFAAGVVLDEIQQGFRGITVADIAGDGDFDLIACSAGGRVTWYESRADGTIGIPVFVSQAPANAICAGDLDGDGDPEVVAVDGVANTLSSFENMGVGPFSSKAMIDDDGAAWTTCLADMDGDGDLDLVVAATRLDAVAWYEQLGGGAFGPRQIVSVGLDRVRGLAVGDIDGDEMPDVVAASNGLDEITWHRNLGGGVFAPGVVISDDAAKVQDVSLADIDFDGDLDVLAASRGERKLAWYQNDGGGVFNYGQLISKAVLGVRSVVAADIDGDGDQDVVACGDVDNTVSWFENVGGGGKYGGKQVLPGSNDGAVDVMTADLDGDGDPDVLCASYLDGEFTVWENQGGGVFGGEQILSSGSLGAWSMAVGDLDGDGDLDVIGTSFYDGTVLWFENLGGFAFGPGQSLGSPVHEPRQALAGDLDGDGDVDLFLGGEQGIGWHRNERDDPALQMYELIGGQSAKLQISRCTPGGLVFAGYSRRGGGPLTTPIGVVLLDLPVFGFPPKPADAGGIVRHSGFVPPLAIGAPIWVHSWDKKTEKLSNGLALVIR